MKKKLYWPHCGNCLIYYITRSFLWTTKIRAIMTIGIDLFHDTSVLAIFSHPNTWGDDNHSDKQQRWLAKMSMTCDVHGVVRRHDGPCFWTCGSFSKMMRVWPAPAPSGFVCGVTVAARGAFPTGPEWSGFCPLCRKAPKTCCELKSIYYILLVANHYLWHKTDTFSDKTLSCDISTPPPPHKTFNQNYCAKMLLGSYFIYFVRYYWFISLTKLFLVWNVLFFKKCSF